MREGIDYLKGSLIIGKKGFHFLCLSRDKFKNLNYKSECLPASNIPGSESKLSLKLSKPILYDGSFKLLDLQDLCGILFCFLHILKKSNNRGKGMKQKVPNGCHSSKMCQMRYSPKNVPNLYQYP